MKKSYTIFYSWMTDRPEDQNIKYIRRVLQDDCKKLEKKFDIKIAVDSDSRGANGDDTIDATILKKISASDLFVCDVTPVRKQLLSMSKAQDKLIPNPNAVFELGFAVASLGWSRCILVWNEKYGDVRRAPFDIRNHLTIPYHIEKRPLSFYGVLKEKIEGYDVLVAKWRSAKERSFDAERYADINEICPERELLDNIRHFLTNRVYSRKTFTQWDDLTHSYFAYPDTHFVDLDLHQSYSNFLASIERLESFAATNNHPLHTNKYIEAASESEEWEEEYRYIIRKPFDYISDPDEAFRIQEKMEKEISEIGTEVLQSYQVFRDKIREKLLI